MSDMKHDQTQEAAFDDVDRLFARLGSKGADGYRDFTPGKLPSASRGAAPVQARRVAADPAPPPPAPPILAAIRPLRAEPVAPLAVPAEAAPASPLGELFQRLLQADVAPASAGPLRRMFGR